MKGAVLCIALAMSATCLADRAAAKRAYERAVTQYNLGEYQAALDGFTTAYTEFPDPRLLYNLAQCNRMLGGLQQKQKAITLYKSYLRESDNAPNSDEVKRIIAVLESEIAREQKSKQGPPQGVEPPAPAVDGHAKTVAAPPQQRLHAGWLTSLRKGGSGLLCGGVLIGVIGIGLAARAPGLASDAQHAGSITDGRRQHDQAVTFNAAGWSLIGVGAAVAVAGAVMVGLPRRSDRVQAWISPAGAGIRGEW